MKVDILTLFPEMFKGPFDTSMLKKAQDNNLAEIKIHNLRDWTTDKQDISTFCQEEKITVNIKPIS